VGIETGTVIFATMLKLVLFRELGNVERLIYKQVKYISPFIYLYYFEG